MLSLEKDILPYLSCGPVAVGQVPTPPLTDATGRVTLRHAFYGRSIQHVLDLKEVFSDSYPRYLDINRPNESAKNKAYRKRVYRNPFRSYANRVKNALDFIRQADDFEVKFPTLPENTRDRLEDYTGTGFSASGSVVNWFFEYAVRDYLNDPNSVLLTLPEEGTRLDTQYPEPRLQLFPSEYVWMHRKGKKAVLCSPRRTMLPQGDGTEREEGLILFFCDHDSYTIARQVGLTRSPATARGGARAEWDILGLRRYAFDAARPELGIMEIGPGGLSPDTVAGTVVTFEEFNPPMHYCPSMPAMKLGKLLAEKNAQGEEYFESLIADAVPHIKDGQQAKSDMQIELNFHISSKEWQRQPRRCTNPACTNGQIAQVKKNPGDPLTMSDCPKCKGLGLDLSGSGLDILYVSDGETQGMQVGAGGQRVPSGAPGGFIPRSIEPLQELSKELQRCTLEAFTTINMQFIRETPLEVSGASKRYDREEMYRSLNNEGAHLVGWILQRVFEFIDAQRYGPAGRKGKQTPTILVPVRYNLENAELVRQELNDAKLNKYDSTIIEGLEKKMLEYSLGKTSEQYRRYDLRTRMDPFRDMNDEIKFYTLGIQYMLYAPGPEQILAIERMFLSINFDGLVSDCVLETPEFWQLDLNAQREVLMAKNRTLIGQLQEKGMGQGGANPGVFPQIDALSFKPLVDLQNMAQTSDSFINPKK